MWTSILTETIPVSIIVVKIQFCLTIKNQYTNKMFPKNLYVFWLLVNRKKILMTKVRFQVYPSNHIYDIPLLSYTVNSLITTIQKVAQEMFSLLLWYTFGLRENFWASKVSWSPSLFSFCFSLRSSWCPDWVQTGTHELSLILQNASCPKWFLSHLRS